MYSWIPRMLLNKLPANRTTFRLLTVAVPVDRSFNQVEYMKSLINSSSTIDWSAIKKDICSKGQTVNEKNFDGMFFKVLLSQQQIDKAISFANHLLEQKNLSLGSINGILSLYYGISKSRALNETEKKFIIDSYNDLYAKHKILDYLTCEKLIQALSVIDEWEKCLKVLEDIYVTSIPGHTAYSLIIAALFRNNKKKKALELIQRSLDDKRTLQFCVYQEWVNHVLTSYKVNKTQLKHLDEIFIHISRHYAAIDEKTTLLFKETYTKLGWNADYSKINKNNGKCSNCQNNLECYKLSKEEFNILQQNVKDKLIVGSDLFLKSTPEELKRFLKFVEDTAPYDIVIDALNVAYAVGRQHAHWNNVNFLLAVVNHFKKLNKKILLLGRKHMIKWNKSAFDKLRRETCSFFTDNISQDDPYFITAAILSGSHTDFVSKDLLRSHQFLMKDQNLGNLLKKWQWEHQWMAFTNHNAMNIKPPLPFTPCAQKNVGWHVPFVRDSQRKDIVIDVNDGTPDLSAWLCIQPKLNEKK